MKTLKLIPIMLCLLFLNACSSSDDNSSTDATTLINTAKSGTWHVTSFTDSGNDETSHFANYNFTFGASNLLTATNGTNTYSGTWSVTSDDSGDDNPSGDLDFNIAFASPADFAELSEDWDIVSYSSTQIALIHISGGNGGTDTLVFTKN